MDAVSIVEVGQSTEDLNAKKSCIINSFQAHVWGHDCLMAGV